MTEENISGNTEEGQTVLEDKLCMVLIAVAFTLEKCREAGADIRSKIWDLVP